MNTLCSHLNSTQYALNMGVKLHAQAVFAL